MNGTTAVCAVLGLVAVAGCAGPREDMAAKRQIEKAAEVRRYCDARFADPRIDPVRDRIQLPIDFDAPQDVERLADRDYPTPAEREAVKVLWDARTACRRYGESVLGPMPNYRAESEEALVDLFGDLHEGTLTYGQFARRLLFVGARDKRARDLLDDAKRARDTASVD